MINTKEYSEAITELIEILQHMDEEMIEKIPLEVIKNLNEQKSKEYTPNVDFSDKNEIKNIKPETKALLAVIYRDYLCDEDEKREFNKKIQENSDKENEKYKVEFSKNENSKNEFLPVTVVEESFWKKIVNKIFKR